MNNKSVFLWRSISFQPMLFSWLDEFELPNKDDIETMIKILEQRNLFNVCGAVMDLWRCNPEEMRSSHHYRNEGIKENLKLIKMLKEEL